MNTQTLTPEIKDTQELNISEGAECSAELNDWETHTEGEF